VLYDPASRLAADAMGGLGDAFEARPLGDQPIPDEAGMVMVIGTDAVRPAAAGAPSARVVAIVPAGDGHAPPDCYAAVPSGAGRGVLARAIANAFADLEARGEIAKLRQELRELNAIGIGLSAERDPVALLGLILAKARAITASDAGSLYLVETGADGERQLSFALTQNDSLDLPFTAATLPLSSASVAGHVALTGQPVNLPDAYRPPDGAPYRINRTFDDRVGYRTRSMLVVPMRTPPGETIGVLQLINCKPGHPGPLPTPQDVERHVRPFSSRYEELALSLASQAAVALDNSRLYQSIRRLFEGFVAASVTAIESRDPTTSGHSFRVAELTVGLAEAVDRCRAGPYAGLRLGADEVRELRYAALLHDFGKVGVREPVLLKAKKLYPLELERIRQRVALLGRGLQLRCAEAKLDHLARRGRRGFEQAAARLEAELASGLADLEASLARIVAANEPTVLPSDAAARIGELAQRAIETGEGAPRTLLTAEEAAILSIPRGSLTPDETAEIRSHVLHTWDFLAQIPWTREFRRVPEIARSHHEKLDGSGYPDGLRGEAIPVQSRIMTIADIYDALTAADRPYKNAVPRDRALDILAAERRAGAIDADLLDLFLEARVFERAHGGA
jgi:HD-GYP domain-containing protein (c-di-GMP phosphodiesterase class II)